MSTSGPEDRHESRRSAGLKRRMERLKELDQRAAATHKRLWIVASILAVLIAGWQIYAATRSNSPRPLVARAVSPDGTRLAGVRIEFIPETAVDGNPAFTATTGSDGTVPLPAKISADGFFLRAKSEDGVLSQSFGQRGLANEIVFEPASPVRGSVSSRLGLPLDGAKVSVRFGTDRAPVLASTTSGKDGRFVIDNVSGSLDFLFIEAKKVGYSPLSIEWERSDEPIELELDPALDLRVRVFLPSGLPASDLPVRLEKVPGSETRTDREGRAIFAGLRRDLAYSVEIAVPRLTYLRQSLQPSSDVHRIDLTVPGSIRGRVVNHQGLPLPGVEVRHGHGPRRWVRTKTDQDGAFHLTDVPGGRIEIFYETGSRVGSTVARLEAGQHLDGFVIRVAPD